MVKRRNKEKTMNQILLATGEIIAQQGIDSAGINAIAHKAGVNKVLIYRYFGGWNGLIEALYEQILFSINKQVEEENEKSAPAICEMYAVQYFRELRTNQVWQLLLRWQMDNKLTELAQRLAALQNQSIQQTTDNDVIEAGVLHLLIAGITHLVLMKDTQEGGGPLDLAEQVLHRIYAPLT